MLQALTGLVLIAAGVVLLVRSNLRVRMSDDYDYMEMTPERITRLLAEKHREDV